MGSNTENHEGNDPNQEEQSASSSARGMMNARSTNLVSKAKNRTIIIIIMQQK